MDQHKWAGYTYVFPGLHWVVLGRSTFAAALVGVLGAGDLGVLAGDLGGALVGDLGGALVGDLGGALVGGLGRALLGDLGVRGDAFILPILPIWLLRKSSTSGMWGRTPPWLMVTPFSSCAGKEKGEVKRC